MSPKLKFSLFPTYIHMYMCVRIKKTATFVLDFLLLNPNTDESVKPNLKLIVDIQLTFDIYFVKRSWTNSNMYK